MVEVMLPPIDGRQASEPPVAKKKNEYYLDTVPSLVTQLLEEVRQEFITGDEIKAVKMRAKISKVIEIVNGDSRLAGIVLKDRRQSIQRIWSKEKSFRNSEMNDSTSPHKRIPPNITVVDRFSELVGSVNLKHEVHSYSSEDDDDDYSDDDDFSVSGVSFGGKRNHAAI